MPIYRGDGGSAETSNNATVNGVAQDAAEAAASASAAATSASAAASSATSAATSKTAAETAETNAETSETNAATSATNASASATAASFSATAAASSATAASTSETNAASSATTATTKASEASTSATNAATSESNAATSATNAATSATNAATSETNASNAQTAAETAQTAAETAQAAAEAAQASIDGFFLGALSSTPTVDGNGDPVTAGDWYFDTTDTQTYIYDGSSWQSINPDLVGDTTPQLGGTLDANGNNIDMGVNVITDTKVGQWDTAYGWGDHSTAGYLTSYTETNDLTAAVTWANVPDANITQSSVTQHQAALSITESQISDLGTYLSSGDTAASLTITSADINGGAVDGTTIGGTTAAAGTFTAFTSNGIDDNGTSTSLTIDSSGNFLLNRTTTPAVSDTSDLGWRQSLGTLYLNSNTLSGPLILNQTYADTASRNQIRFYRNETQVGSILSDSTSTSYNTTSDQRLKKNITNAPAGNIDDIRICSFDWKVNGLRQTYGILAQELVQVAPEAVSQGDTEDDMWSVDYSKLIPMMIKEIQDLKAEVAALQAN
jgi:hypothetical protein